MEFLSIIGNLNPSGLNVSNDSSRSRSNTRSKSNTRSRSKTPSASKTSSTSNKKTMASKLYPESDWRENGDWEITWQLPLDVAKLLDSQEIPYVLWGAVCKSIIGVPSCEDDRIEFIIPDDRMEVAKTLLKGAKYHRCTPEKFPDCGQSSKEDLHYHLHPPSRKFFTWGRRPDDGPDNDFAITLHPKSTMLWASPDLPHTIDRKDPNYMYSTRSRAAFVDKAVSFSRDAKPDEKPYGLKVLTPAGYFNALAFYALRYQYRKGTMQRDPEMHLCGLAGWLIREGLVKDDQVDPRVLPIWVMLKENPSDFKGHCGLIDRIRLEMVGKGELDPIWI